MKQTERAENVLLIKNLGSQSLSAVFSCTTLASINFATRLVFLALLPRIRVRIGGGGGGGEGAWGGGGGCAGMLSNDANDVGFTIFGGHDIRGVGGGGGGG